MKALSIITATIGMSFIHSLTTRISKNGELFSNLRFNVRALSSSSIESDILERKSDWIEYMVEFRGVQSAFRLNEFRDSYKQLMRGKDDEEIELTSIIADVLQPNIPVCAYVRLPNESIAIAVAKRCSLVRSISQVWGDAITMEEVRIETEQNYDTLVAPIFKESNSLQDNSWRVDFRRYGRSGRSGLDPEGKKNVLKAFSSILKNMKGVVSLSDAKHNLLYLEDWSSYRSWTLQIDAAARIKADADRILELDLVVEESREEDGRATSVTSVTLVEDAAPATTTARVAISENIVPDANTHACVTGDNGVSTEKRVETYEENRIRRNEAIINRNKRNGTLGGDKAAQTNGSSHSGRMDSGINKKERRLNSVSEDTKRNENKKNKGELNSEAFISNNMMRKQNSLYQPSIGEINHDDGTYVPLKCVLARVIAEGPCVVSDFDLKRRPYLGTTTMDPVMSHLAAVAAHATWNQTILDPFCGTGSLMIACAFLGANVVGSDVDGDCLGKAPIDIPLKARSKNTRFLRHGSNNVSQEGKSTYDNFVHYNLTDRLTDLLWIDAARWANRTDARTDTGESTVSIVEKQIVDLDKYGKFDAIVTDPPYSKREKAVTSSSSSSSSPMGDSLSTTSCLLALASHRLKSGGRLVFWLPTSAHVSIEDVRNILNQTEASATLSLPSGTLGLRFQRATAEEMNNSLWRWLCIYDRI